MLTITANTSNLAWLQCLKQLCYDFHDSDNIKYFRDELTVIEILQPCIEEAPTEFPMLQSDLDVINNYLITGENEDMVKHEWTKLYFQRIYSEPNNQYSYLLQQLGKKDQSGRAQISLWDKTIDQDADIAPCTQIIWARVKHNLLELHIHAHSVDAYKKLLMNQQEFITLQYHIAKQLEIGVGKFYHVIDSCHIYKIDVNKVENLIRQLDV